MNPMARLLSSGDTTEAASWFLGGGEVAGHHNGDYMKPLSPLLYSSNRLLRDKHCHGDVVT